MKNTSSFICVFIILLFTSSAHADEGKIVDAFVAHAYQGKNRGQIRESIEDFARALLLNPHNKQAQEGLTRQAFAPELSSQDRLSLLSIKDLLKLNADLADRKSYLSDKIGILKSYVLKSGYDHKKLDRELKELKKELMITNRISFDNYDDPVAALQNMLLSKREDLYGELGSLEQEIAYLRTLSKSQRDVSAYKDVVKDDNLTNVVIDESKGSYQDFKGELEALKTRVKDLEKIIDVKDRKLDKLSQQIVELSLEVSEEKIDKDKRGDNIDEIGLQLGELKSRLELGQKIIQEKDDAVHELENKMSFLEKEVARQKKEFENALAQKESFYTEQINVLALYKAKLYDKHVLVKEQNAKISSLNDQIDLMENKLFYKELALNQTKDSLEDFELDLENLERALSLFAPDDPAQRRNFYSQILDLQDRLKRIQTSL